MNQNSLTTYEIIKKDGSLNTNQWKLYSILYDAKRPMTRNELLSRAGLQHNQSGRFTELIEMGVIEPTGEKRNSVKGCPSDLLQVTGRLPTKPEKKPSSKNRAYLIIASLKSNMFLTSEARVELDELEEIIKGLK